MPSGPQMATDTLEAVRQEVTGWIAARWRPGAYESDFISEVVDAGWALPTLPPDVFGRGMTTDEARVVIATFEELGAPMGEGYFFQNFLAVQAVCAFPVNDQLRDAVRKLLTGDHLACLLYSEPGAGSDLAAVQTRAERDGADWVLNGQKVWTSHAFDATHGLVVVRTNWDVPKHKGMTVFLVEMEQPGVEVRPIVQITGKSTFNEVFFTDARVPDHYRIGELDDGWAVLQLALAHERMVMGNGMTRTRDEGDMTTRSPVEMLIPLAVEYARADESWLRQGLARLHSLERIGEWNAARNAGIADPKVASIIKLAKSEVRHGAARLHAAILRSEALLAAGDSAQARHANDAAMDAFQISISGGSDQIQRNLIGERVLGLPREPAIDQNIAFRDVPKAEAIRRNG